MQCTGKEKCIYVHDWRRYVEGRKTGNSFKVEEAKFVLSCGADHAWNTALAQPYDDIWTASDRSIFCRQGAMQVASRDCARRYRFPCAAALKIRKVEWRSVHCLQDLQVDCPLFQ